MKNSVSTCLALLFGSLVSTASAQTITTQPASVTVNTASSAEFTVTAANATSYQWYFNATNQLVDGGDISGSTNSTLTLENVSAGEMGTYSVVINSNLVSSNATLTVIPGTVIEFT